MGGVAVAEGAAVAAVGNQSHCTRQVNDKITWLFPVVEAILENTCGI